MPLLVPTPSTLKQKARFVVRMEAAPGVRMEGRFTKAGPLKAGVATSSLRSGGSMIPRKAPSLVNFENITLERGATQDGALQSWFAQIVAPTPDIGGLGFGYARDLDIVELDRGEITLNRWRVFRAFPVDYTAADGYDNEDEGFLMEMVELTYDFFVPIGLPGGVRIDAIAHALG